jgi:DNA polymerase III epsilon subunit-like protein
MILHDLVAMKSVVEFLIENNFFEVVCSIITIKREYRGGYGGILTDGEEDPIFSVNKYHYEIVNPKDQMYFSSDLFGIDTEYKSGLFIDEFNLKLVVWDLLFSMNNLSSILDAPIFFQKQLKYTTLNLNESDLFRTNEFDEELWNYRYTWQPKKIHESFFNGSLIDFILKIEISDQDFGYANFSQTQTNLLSSDIVNDWADSLPIDECHVNSSFYELSKSTFIHAKRRFVTLDFFISDKTSTFNVAHSKMILHTTNPSIEEIFNMINNPLLDSKLNFKNVKYSSKLYILFIDCETTSITDTSYPPRLVSLSWCLTTFDGILVDAKDILIKPFGYEIDENATKIHGISNEKARKNGILLEEAKEIFEIGINHNEIAAVVGHNIGFDMDVLKGENFNLEGLEGFCEFICTMKNASKVLNNFENKWPKLNELFHHFFQQYPHKSHNSLQDVHSTLVIYFKMLELGLLPKFSMPPEEN